MLSKLLLLQFVIIVHSVLQDMRSMKLTKLMDTKYRCTGPGCSASTIVSVSSLRNCQIACLADAQCGTASFSQSINQCELFADIPNEYGTLSEEANVITMIAIDGRQPSTRSSINWLTNGNGETGLCNSVDGVTHPTDWNYNGPVTQIYYNNTYGDLLYTSPGPSDRGNCYFTGQYSAVTSMWQTVNMTGSINPSFIDSQALWFNFSAWIGGYANQDDNAEASLTFTDQANQQMGNITTLGPILAADRGSISSLIFRQANGLVPIGARSFIVVVTMTRVTGAYNDGLIDNIAVVLYP